MPSTDIQTRDPDELLVIIDEQDQVIESWYEEIRLLKQKRFGASNEAYNTLQVPLFPVDDTEVQAFLANAERIKPMCQRINVVSQKNAWYSRIIFRVSASTLTCRNRRKTVPVAKSR